MIAECLPNADYFARQQLEKVNRFSADRRVPLWGHIDITYRCNLRCIHCYAGSERVSTEITEESTAPVIREILQEAAAMGCLRLLISGGEPLLRPDFEEIYKTAKELGIIVTVFTNATLVTDRHVKLLQEFPPYLVEISIYGATAATYESVTGVPGSYAACITGIERLLAGKIRSALKTPMLQRNIHELGLIEGLAKKCGLSFRIDPIIIPQLNRDKTSLEQRIDPAIATAVEFTDGSRAQFYKEHYRTAQESQEQKTLYDCKAGVTKFHIDPAGIVRPCFMIRNIKHSTIEAGFKVAWHAVCADFLQLPAISSTRSCGTCNDRSLCGYCPGMFYLENGSYGSPPSDVCKIALHRKEKVLSISQ